MLHTDLLYDELCFETFDEVQSELWVKQGLQLMYVDIQIKFF
jgi:hypothetical protein